MANEKDAERIRRRAKSSTATINQISRDAETAVARFTSGDRSIEFNIDATAETVWATQQQIADLYRVDRSVISKHLCNIFDEGELERDSVRAKNARTAGDGKTYEVWEYSLDAIISVGYRVSSKAATKFRRWANEILRSYITQGYALNERRLRRDVQATDNLAARVRAIRAEEKHLFAKVRDAFKEASSDYDGSTRACRTFYALVQDKFHYAASGMTACQLVLDRADHRRPNMGLTTFAGERPTVQDAKVGKNYLSEEELHVLRIVSEQFLLYVESRAVRGRPMTMKELISKFDELLRVNGYDVFVGWEKDFKRDKADKHAMAEFGRFLVRERRVARIEAR